MKLTKIYLLLLLALTPAIGYPITLSQNYPGFLEKLVYFKDDGFRIYYGGPIDRPEKGVKWVMPVTFENKASKTKSVYEIAFVGCTMESAKDAEVLFIDVSDINIKFKNRLCDDYKVFSDLMNGRYSKGKYIIVRSSDLSIVCYPDVHIAYPSATHIESEKQAILDFLVSHFHTKNKMVDYFIGKSQGEIAFETAEETQYKSIPLQIELKGKMETFYLIKRILNNDPWKAYYIISKESLNHKVLGSEIPLVRLDSGCISGQIYDDEACDCLDQLHEGLYQLAHEQKKMA